MVFKTLFGSTRKVKTARKYLIDWEGASKSMTFDFYNATQNIVIEVQGRQHTKFVPFMHANSKINYLKQLKRDEDKIKFCEINEISFFEYFDGDNKLPDLDKMLDL